MYVLTKRLWPGKIPSNYGKAEIAFLCKRFKPSSHSVINAFSNYVIEHRDHIAQDYWSIHNLFLYTAGCEWGFSHTSLIITIKHRKIPIHLVSALIFAKLHWPPLVHWNLEPYTISWLQYHKLGDDIRTRVSSNPPKHTMLNPLWKL